MAEQEQTAFDFIRETLNPQLKESFKQVPGTVRTVPALIAVGAKVLAQKMAENDFEGIRDVLDLLQDSTHIIRKDMREGWLWYLRNKPHLAAAWAKEYERRQHIPGNELEGMRSISDVIQNQAPA